MVPRKPRFVIIMTDTQRQDMVGAYGNPAMDTMVKQACRKRSPGTLRH